MRNRISNPSQLDHAAILVQDAPAYCIGKAPGTASGALRLPRHALLGAVIGPRPHVELIRQSRRPQQGEVAEQGEVRQPALL